MPMKKKYVFVFFTLLVITLAGMGMTSLYAMREDSREQSGELSVVTSFYPMYIAAMNVVGDLDGVKLTNLSEPQMGCLHDFQLTPEDMKLLSTADVFVINGGGIESFIEKVASSYPSLKIVEACNGIPLLQEEDEENAHAWMSIGLYEQQVENIAKGLAAADPSHEQQYESNAKEYCRKLEDLRERQQAVCEVAKGQNVILFHEAYAYVAKDYGMNVSYVLDLDEERQVSAGEVSDLLSAVQKDHVKYILAEKRYGQSMGNTIEKESDAEVIYLDPLNRGDYDKDRYLKGMSENIGLLEQYFRVTVQP